MARPRASPIYVIREDLLAGHDIDWHRVHNMMDIIDEMPWTHSSQPWNSVIRVPGQPRCLICIEGEYYFGQAFDSEVASDSVVSMDVPRMFNAVWGKMQAIMQVLDELKAADPMAGLEQPLEVPI